MSFPRYPRYKDSGVEWLGEVPEHWDVTPLKYIARFASGGTPNKASTDYWDGDVPWASSKDLKSETLSDTCDHITQLAIDEGAAVLVPAGSVLVVVRGMILLHTFPVVQTLVPMAINQDLKALTPINGATATYLPWLLRGSATETFSRVDEAAHGTKVIRMESWASIALPIPPRPEQAAIAAFLDRETAKTDALIAAQQRLIELLQEKRQAVISHAVTKGLNPDAPMKDSGIEWLGKVPEHWEVCRVKAVSSFTTSGPRGWSERVGEDGSLFVQSGDLTDSMEVDFANCKRVQVGEDAEAARTRLQDGDVVVCVTGAKTGNVAVCTSVPEASYVNQHVCLIRPTARVMPLFLGMVLKSGYGETYFSLSQYGLKQGLSLEDVREAPVIRPPIEEQRAIIQRLTGLNTNSSSLVAEAERAITLLQERRSALISAAVTGQIDVRGLAGSEAA